MALAINICSEVYTEHFADLEPVLERLTNLIIYEDTKIQESALSCFVLLTEHFMNEEGNLMKICSPDLLGNLLTLVSSQDMSSFSETTTATASDINSGLVFRILATTCRSSTSLMTQLLDLGLCHILDSTLMQLSCDSVVANSRYSQQVYNIITLVNELLPTLPEDV